MQDRFRFRIWSKERQAYYKNAQASADFVVLMNLSSCVVEQCTGLKDKNGTLIYEGDSVNVCYSYFDGVGFSDRNYSGTVVWDGYSLSIKEDGRDVDEFFELATFNFFDGQSDEIEVVGNSHENKKG